jgi:hypothetical protein
MSSLFDSWIKFVATNSVAAHVGSLAFKAQVAKHVRWSLQGFEAGFGFKRREAFTLTVARRLHEKAREPVYLFGRRIWRRRMSWEWCEAEAENIVSNWLTDERIKFGDANYHWDNGVEIADADMEYWEACP